MAEFREIDYSKMLYEILREPLSINEAGDLSYLYKFSLCCIYPMQSPFNNFDTWRQKQYIIANCKYTIGHLKNVLNYLYDNVNFFSPDWGRITITQSTTPYLYVPIIDETTESFPLTIDNESEVFAPTIDTPFGMNDVTINIPTDLSSLLAEILSTIDQIKIDGLTYKYQLV